LSDRMFFFSFTGTRSTMHADSARMGEGSMSQMTVKTWRYHSNDLFLRPSGCHAISCWCI
jgi:hypothetical protein